MNKASAGAAGAVRWIGATLLLTAGCASVAPDMVRLEPGSYVAGSSRAETDRAGHPAELAAREQPARTVTIAQPFAIGRTEVTVAQYARFAKATGRRSGGSCSHLVDGPANRWAASPERSWSAPGFAQTAGHPVVCVSHGDATAFAAWLSEVTGRRFRLPSGAEWEYAARAGTATPRWWGEGDDVQACRHANLSDAARARAHNRGMVDPSKFFPCDDGHVFTAPVGSFAPSPWGLHDMLGNVWEWTLDCVNPDQRDAPADAAPRLTGDCASRMDRGGSWTNSPRYVRAAAQHPDLADARTTVLGFRLLEELP